MYYVVIDKCKGEKCSTERKCLDVYGCRNFTQDGYKRFTENMTSEQRFRGSGSLIQENNDKSGKKCSCFNMLQGRPMKFLISA